MKFEISDDDQTAGKVTLEDSERTLVNKVLHAVLISAATSGNEQLDPDSAIHTLARIMLAPEHFNSTAITMNARHLEALADATTSHTEGIPYDQAQMVGGFIGQLRVAGRVLQQSSEMVTPSDEAIDRIVGEIEIPDSPEGLV